MSARAVGSATIGFGLVSIPVKLYTAAAKQRVTHNRLHAHCKGRMKQQYLCPHDNVVVERAHTVRGFEFARDQYVTFTDDELKKLEHEHHRGLELVEFVPRASVDLAHLGKAHYVGPDYGADRAYQLLARAMRQLDVLAVGKLWRRGRERLVLLSPYHAGLILHEVWYTNEVRSFDDVGIGAPAEFAPDEVKLAVQLVGRNRVDAFKVEKYRDEVEERVLDAVETKVAAEEVSVSEEAPKAQIIDLFEALKRSLAAEPKKTQPAVDAGDEQSS